MDDDLIRRAKQGERSALGELYELHSSRVYSIVRRLAGDDAQAEDWAHEAWLRAFRALPDFRGDSRFSTWLHRIAVNSALHGRRTIASMQGRIDLPESTPELAGREDQPLLRTRLEQAIDQLPEGMRRVLVLHDVEGYTHQEIGELLGVSVGTSKSQLFRARARMRELLRTAILRT
jgi:RNA polymerase sigma-70 factor, ECF subfamily